MKKIILGSVAVLFLLATIITIATFRSTEKTIIHENELFVDNMGNFSTYKGFYYINQEKFLQFYDYQSNQNTIVCNKPNCEHKIWNQDTPLEQRCHAYSSECQSLFIYRGKLYMVQTNTEKESLQIVESDPDRSNQKILADLNSEYIGSYLLKDGKLYFATLVSELVKDESGMPVQSGFSLVTICRLDMETGKTEELYRMDKHYNAQLSIIGICNGTMYCYYGYFEKKFTGLNFQEAQKRGLWYAFDLDTMQMTPDLQALSDIDINLMEIAGDKLFYGKWIHRDSEVSDIFCYDLGKKENKKILSDSFNFTSFDNKIIARNDKTDECMIYDIASGNVKNIKQKENEVSILAEYGDHFMVASYQKGEVVYGHMKKEDYYSGSSDFKILKKEQTIDSDDSLIWVIDDARLAQRLQEPLNQLLKEKGISYTVSIIGGEPDTYEERRTDYLKMLGERKSARKATDLIYLPWTQAEDNDYASAVKQGLLKPLELEEGSGSISEILGEFAVESVKVNGTVYGMRGLPEYFNFGLAFNEYYLNKYAIPKESLSGNILKNEELFLGILKEDEKVRTPAAYWALTEEQLGYHFLYPSCAVGFSYDNKDEIVNVFAQKDTKEYLEALKHLRDENLITFLNIDGFDTLDTPDSYLAISHYGTRTEPYSFEIKDFIDKKGNPITTNAVFVPDHLDQQSLFLIPRGNLTGIASWSENPKQAYDFLKLLYTDPDVANLVKFGVEGQDYKTENGRVTEMLNPEIYPRANIGYINDVITYPMEQEPDDKQENWIQYFKKHSIHPLTGFQFDSSNVEEEIKATNALLKTSIEIKDSYTDDLKKLLSGDVEDIEKALEKLNGQLEKAGISKITEEANRQIKEWKTHQKG